jgi:glutaconyl-CoA decarboxylase
MKYRVTLNGKVYEVEVERGEAIITNEYEAASFSAPVSAQPTYAAQPAPAAQAAPAAGEVINSPLPGVVVNVKVSAGDKDKKGQTLLLIEAMKMENEVVAPRDCAVVQIIAKPGATVSTGDPLLVIG